MKYPKILIPNIRIQDLGSMKGFDAMTGPRRNQVHVEFVQTELLLARTFCYLAKSKSFSGRSRCIQYARTAYNAATRFMLTARMNDAEFITFSANLEKVKFVLEALESR